MKRDVGLRYAYYQRRA